MNYKLQPPFTSTTVKGIRYPELVANIAVLSLGAVVFLLVWSVTP